MAQNWSTGNIPRFEILHKFKITNLTSTADREHNRTDQSTNLKVPPWNSFGLSFPARAFSANSFT